MRDGTWRCFSFTLDFFVENTVTRQIYKIISVAEILFPWLSIDQSFALRSKRYNCHKYTSATVNRSILPYSKTTSTNQTRGSARLSWKLSFVSVPVLQKTQRQHNEARNEVFHESIVYRDNFPRGNYRSINPSLLSVLFLTTYTRATGLQFGAARFGEIVNSAGFVGCQRLSGHGTRRRETLLRGWYFGGWQRQLPRGSRIGCLTRAVSFRFGGGRWRLLRWSRAVWLRCIFEAAAPSHHRDHPG